MHTNRTTFGPWPASWKRPRDFIASSKDPAPRTTSLTSAVAPSRLTEPDTTEAGGVDRRDPLDEFLGKPLSVRVEVDVVPDLQSAVLDDLAAVLSNRWLATGDRHPLPRERRHHVDDPFDLRKRKLVRKLVAGGDVTVLADHVARIGDLQVDTDRLRRPVDGNPTGAVLRLAVEQQTMGHQLLGEHGDLARYLGVSHRYLTHHAGEPGGSVGERQQ